MSTLGVTELVIKGELVNLKTIHSVNRHTLNRRVLDVEVVNLGVGKLVGSKELGLSSAAVATVTIPVLVTLTVENSARALNSDLVTGDFDKGTLPLLVAPGGGALEDDLGVVLEVAEVKSLSSGDLEAVEDDGAARLLGSHGLLGTAGAGEGAAVALGVGVDIVLAGGSRRSSEGAASQGSDEDGGELGHFDGVLRMKVFVE